MKHVRLFAALVCCVATLALPVTPALPAGAEPQTQGDFRYSVMDSKRNDHAYAEINGYTGNAKEVIVPAVIDGLPVECIHNLWGSTAHTPERLVIPEGVRAIGGLFREYNGSLTEVVLPSTLKVIGQSAYSSTAFGGCEALTSLTVPPSVSLIVGGKGAFPRSTVLRVEAGSYAHRWAKANEQPFEIIEHAPSVGDYDADGLTTTTDARLLLQKAANKVIFSEEQAAVADVDGDGEVTTTDARLTLQYAVGKEAVDSLTCPLTFNSPLIPPEAVGTVRGSIIARTDDTDNPELTYLPNRNYYYSVEGHLLTRQRAMVDYLNERIGQEYNSRYVATITGWTTGATAEFTVDGISSVINYRFSYYGLSMSVQLDSQFHELIME